MAESRTAVVIGASKGIGLAAVAALVARGFQVWGSVRDPEGQKAVELAGGQAVHLDLLDESSIAAAAQTIRAAAADGVDVLVLNAGVGQPGAVEDVPLRAWRDTFETNLFGPVAVLQAMLPALRRRKGARVIWVGSVLGMVGLAFRGTYVATKFAMEGVADSLKIELAEEGLHVVVVQPGPVATDFRKTARQRFDRVDRINSHHAGRYEGFTRRMEQPDVVGGDTVSAQKAAEAIVRAATDIRPRARYRVCRSTHWVEILRRMAPRELMAWIGLRAMKRECGTN